MPIFSRGMQYVATTICDSPKNRSSGQTVLWNVRTGEPSCSFRFSEFHDSAFSEDETTFVTFSRGKAQYRDVATGTVMLADPPIIFPHDDDPEKACSRLMSDPKGRLFVLVREQEKPWTFRDLATGQEVASFSAPPNCKLVSELTGLAFDVVFPGHLMIHKSKERAIEAWEVPTGKHFFSVPSGGILSWSITQDGKKKIFVDGQVHVFDDKDSKRTLNLAGNIFPAISIDGRYLLVTLENESLPHPVIQSLYNCFGVPDSSKATVLYDLDNAVEIAAFANAGASRFSLDNSKIVTATDDSLSIFDLPLTKPWPKIAAYALSVAGGVFLVGLAFGFIRRKK